MAGYTTLKLGPGEPHVVRDPGVAKAQPGRAQRRRSLAYLSQMTDFQLADEESPARVEFADPAASSAQRPQEALTPFQIEATIRQINRYAGASPHTQGDGTRNAMDFALITGDQADNQHLNETVWVRDLLEGNGPHNFNSGVTDPAFYADTANLSPACNTFVLQAGGPEAAAAEAKRYTGVQDYDDYPLGKPPQPLYYDPDDPTGPLYADWPDYGNLLDRAQEIVIDPEGLKVPFYITNGNHDVLVQGNEDAIQPIEEIALGCFKALASTIAQEAPDPDPDLLTAANAGMLVPPDPGRQFVDKLQIKQIYGATNEGPADDDHGFKHVDPEENEASNGSASYYAWDPPQTPGMRFISIDTNSEGGQTAEGVAPGSSNGNLDDPQFQWIRRELQKAKARDQLVVLFGHHPVRSMNAEVRDEQAVPCAPPESPLSDDGHGHDVNPGCDRDPRPSDDDPATPGVGCIHNGEDEHNKTCPGGHESFEELIAGFPNVVAYVPGHTHEHRLTEYKHTGGTSWWEINTSAVIDYPNQSRLIELMDNRDGTLSWMNTVVDHAAPATAPAPCPADSTNCASAFTEPELASIGRTLTYNDPDNDKSGAATAIHRNAELLLGDPRPEADLGVTQTDAPDPVVEGKPVTYSVVVTNKGPAEAKEVVLTDVLSAGLSVTAATASQGDCDLPAQQVVCRVGTLAKDASATVTITATAGKPGQVSSTATVRGNVSDRVAGNDSEVETTTVVAAPPPVKTPTETPTETPTTAPGDGQATATPTPRATPTATATATPGGPPPGLLPCTARAFDRVEVRPRGRRVDFDFDLVTGATNARIDVFQSSSGRRVLGERLVARFSARTDPFLWNGKATRARRRVTDGIYFARFTATDVRGLRDVRRRVLERRNGRWSTRAAFEKRVSCTLVETFKLERPAFGGTTRRGLRVAYRLNRDARVRVEVLRGQRVVKRTAQVAREAGRTFRVRVDRGLRRRGDYRIRLTASRAGAREVRVLVSRRL